MPAYTSSRYVYEGTETTETSITRVGGASDPTGQAQSRKIVTSANSQWLRPFKAEPYAIWNPTTGANVTVTVCGTVNAGALPNNDDIWLEVEYLGDAGGPSVWEAATATAVTVSGGGLVVTNTGTTSVDQGAHVTASAAKTSGKYYFEIATGSSVGLQGGNVSVGIGTPVSTYTNMGNSATIGTLLFYSGNVWSNGSNSGSALGGALFNNTTICIAVDLDNRLAWFRFSSSGNWNGSGTANPATGVGGVAIPAGAMVPFCTFGGAAGLAGGVMTANFGASSFAGTVPSGFTSGWPRIPASPLGTIVTTTKANLLAANAAVASDSSTWNGGGSGAGWSPFKLVAVLSAPQPGMAGYLHARVRAAKPSVTYYIDPQVTLS